MGSDFLTFKTEFNPTKGSPGSLFISVRTRVAQFFLNRDSRSEFLLLFLLVEGAFLVRIWGISKTHFWDEMVYLQNAQVICCGKINYSELDFRPPLISLIYAGMVLLWHHIYAACIVTAFLNALGPVLPRTAEIFDGLESAAHRSWGGSNHFKSGIFASLFDLRKHGERVGLTCSTREA